MYVELKRAEEIMLVKLVRSRIEALGSEIRQCQEHGRETKLRRELATLHRLLHRLYETEWDVTC